MLPQYQMSGNRPAQPFVILPAIDLQGGRVVRLLRGDHGSATTYGDDPAAVAEAFAAGGAQWLHVVDLDGARDPAFRQTSLVAAIIARLGTRIAVEVAGGLRDEHAVGASLEAGAARVVLGTAALRDPAFVGRLGERFGAERIVVALDVRGRHAVGQGWVQGAAGVVVADALARLADVGCRTFEVTAIDRDGTLQGPDLPLLGDLARLRRGAIVASAGMASAADITAVRAQGCAGAIVGRALYEGRLTIEDALAAAH